MDEREMNIRNGAGVVVEAKPDDGSRSPIRLLLGVFSPAGSRARLTILMFHRVRERPDALFPGEMHAAAFRERMTWIRAWFNVLSLDDAVVALDRGHLPARALAITFDDGYADNYTVALPILHELGMPATFFVCSGFIDGGRMWNDTVIESVRAASGDVLDLSSAGLGTHRIDSAQTRREAIAALLSKLKHLPLASREERANAIAASVQAAMPTDLMLTSSQLKALAAAGMTIGGHTVHHPILARVDDASARREITDGRDALEAVVRQPVRLFAYPNGKPGVDYTAAHVDMIRKLGWTAAVSTGAGTAGAGSPLHELPRFTPWRRTASAWAWSLASNYATPAVRATS